MLFCVTHDQILSLQLLFLGVREHMTPHMLHTWYIMCHLQTGSKFRCSSKGVSYGLRSENNGLLWPKKPKAGGWQRRSKIYARDVQSRGKSCDRDMFMICKFCFEGDPMVMFGNWKIT